MDCKRSTSDCGTDIGMKDKSSRGPLLTGESVDDSLAPSPGLWGLYHGVVQLG